MGAQSLSTSATNETCSRDPVETRLAAGRYESQTRCHQEHAVSGTSFHHFGVAGHYLYAGSLSSTCSRLDNPLEIGHIEPFFGYHSV